MKFLKIAEAKRKVKVGVRVKVDQDGYCGYGTVTGIRMDGHRFDIKKDDDGISWVVTYDHVLEVSGKPEKRVDKVHTLWKALYLNGSKIQSFSGSQAWDKKWRHYKGEPKLCQRGFHAYKDLRNALHFRTSNVVIARVEVKGHYDPEGDVEGKSVWKHMRILEAWDLSHREPMKNGHYIVKASYPSIEEFKENYNESDWNDQRLMSVLRHMGRQWLYAKDDADMARAKELHDHMLRVMNKYAKKLI